MIQAEIIKGCLKNDRKSQYELYRMCYEKFMAICKRYQTDDLEAESVLNTAYLKILSNLNKYSDQYSFDAWCRRITINANIDAYRKKKRVEFTLPSDEYELVAYDHQAAMYDHHEFEAEELMSMIKQLPEIQRKVFNLFAIDGYGHQEISEMLEINVGTSKWYLHDSRKRLKEQIEHRRNFKNNPAYGK